MFGAAPPVPKWTRDPGKIECLARLSFCFLTVQDDVAACVCDALLNQRAREKQTSLICELTTPGDDAFNHRGNGL